MESIAIFFMYLKSDVIRHTFENLEPFLNIKNQEGIYLYRIIIILKMLFALHTAESTFLFSKYMILIMFTIANALIVNKYSSLAFLPAIAQCFLFFAPFKKFALFMSMALICIMSMHIGSCEFMLDLYVVTSMILIACQTYYNEFQKLWTVVTIKLIIGWYISNLHIFSLKQLSLVVCFLLLSYFPLRPNKHKKYKHRLLYCYCLMFMWIAYKFQLTNFRETQPVTGNFELQKKWGYQEKYNFIDNEMLINAGKERSKETGHLEKYANQHKETSEKFTQFNKGWVPNVKQLKNNAVVVIKHAGDGGSATDVKNDQVFDGMQIEDASQNILKQPYFTKRPFPSQGSENERNTAKNATQTFATNVKVIDDKETDEEHLNIFGTAIDDENMDEFQQMLIGMTEQILGVKWSSKNIYISEGEQNVVKSKNKDLSSLDKDSFEEGEEFLRGTTEEKNEKLMLEGSDEDNVVSKLLKSIGEAIKLEQEISDELVWQANLDTTKKNEVKNKVNYETVLNAKETEEISITSMENDDYKSMSEFEKSMVFNENPETVGIMKKREPRRIIIKDDPDIFEFKAQHDVAKENNIRLRLKKHKRLDTFGKQMKEESSDFLSDTEKSVLQKREQNDNNAEERYKAKELNFMENDENLDEPIYQDKKQHKHLRNYFERNLMESSMLEDYTTSEVPEWKSYTLDSLIKTIQNPVSHISKKSSYTGYADYPRKQFSGGRIKGVQWNTNKYLKKDKQN